MKIVKKLMGTISVLLVMGILVAVVYGSYMISKWNEEDPNNHTMMDLNDDDIISDLPSLQIDGQQVVSDQSIINILIVGSDARSANERGRSDSMMIATIDNKNKKLKLTSILRDTYVFLPGNDSKGKPYGSNRINVAYSLGDASFLMKTIEHNFGIKIDKYAVVNFEVFSQIITRIGGLDIELSKEESRYINVDDTVKNNPRLKEGMNNLTGDQALSFARARHAGVFTYTDFEGNTHKVNDDFARTARQRYVLESMFSKVKGESIATLLGIAEDCMENTRTNISLMELKDYMSMALPLGINNIQQNQFPKTYKNEDINGAKVLYLSESVMKENSDILKRFIFEE